LGYEQQRLLRRQNNKHTNPFEQDKTGCVETRTSIQHSKARSNAASRTANIESVLESGKCIYGFIFGPFLEIAMGWTALMA
jgi:hypothetical protein